MEEVIAKIEALSQQPGFIYALSLILLRDLFFSPENIIDVNWHDHLNFQEISFLVGLVVKNEIDFSIPTEEDVQKWFESTYALFEELHEKHYEPFRKALAAETKKEHQPEDREAEYRKFFSAGNMMIESIFYSDSGAYDFQNLEFAVKKYKTDSNWIANHVGLDLPVMAMVARLLKKLHEEKYRTRPWADARSFSELCAAVLSIFCFTDVDLEKMCVEEAAKNFINAFSLNPGKVNAKLQFPGQYNEFQSRPIIRFPSGRYFLPLGFNLSQAIYEGPFYWMNRDAAYRQTALRNRGDFAQTEAAELLRRVFGKGNVFTEVQIEKRKGQTITDIDVLAVGGNKAVIVQVKSKRLTELARLGNTEILIADFKSAVQDAYDQALLSRRAVIDKSNRLLIDGTELHLPEGIDDAYIICLTIDHYPAVTHQVDIYLNKKTDDPLPIAISIFDLDIIAFYLNDAFDFLYYLRQRVRLATYFKADSEIVLLAHHIKHKLFKRSEVDWELVDASLAQLIDANFPVVRGSVPRTAAAEALYPKWKNEKFRKLLQQTKSAAHMGFTDALFLLYDLAGEGADQLIDVLERLKRRTAKDGRLHDASLLITEKCAGVTILTEAISTEAMHKKLYSLCVARKYKSKADAWLGLACLGSSEGLVDVMIFDNDPWVKDEQLERLVETHFNRTGKAMTPSGRKIGRNDPCPCGSRKKFKRCHGK